jgi:hypothetical protein
MASTIKFKLAAGYSKVYNRHTDKWIVGEHETTDQKEVAVLAATDGLVLVLEDHPASKQKGGK